MAVAFDTHQYIKAFEKVGVPEEQAEVTVKMFSEVIEQREQLYRQNLASKQDLQNLESSLKGEIKDTGARLRQEIRDIAISQIKWFTGIMIAQGAAIVALVKLL